MASTACIVLVALAPDGRAQWAAAVFGLTAVLMFGTSAVYHRGTWSPRTYALLRRWDHANIFLLIAGTYTPFAIVILDGRARSILLWVVWTGAVAGVVFRVVWLDAPRWLYVPVYIGLGWIAVFFVPETLDGGGVGVLVLVFTGGALYSLGGLVYSLQRPDPWPRQFGFHEVFHLLTILAFTCHYVAISLATYG